MNKLIKMLASGFGLGYIPYASGTFGTLLGIPIFLLIAGLAPAFYIGLVIIFIIISSLISKKAEVIYGKKDSPIIVIDEVAGYLVTMALIEPSRYSIIIGFILFRFFDIVKVWPAKAFDRRQGGAAVVLDDVIAGIYANILLRMVLKYISRGLA